MSSDVSNGTKKGEAARITRYLLKISDKTYIFSKMTVYSHIILLQLQKK